MSAVPAVVFAAPGTNRDGDVAFALGQAGARAVTVPLTEATPAVLRNARVAVVAGGFSFADGLGSGRLFALELGARLGDSLRQFVEAGRPVIGICNGFQTLVRVGLLPGSLGHNASGVFQCRWVDLAVDPATPCVWTRGIDRLACPVAHGEGRYVATSESTPAVHYVRPDGTEPNGSFPANPNGADDDLAGVTDESGLVLGLMPHPENHVLPRQHPQWRRPDHVLGSHSCLPLFINGVTHAQES
jgi:phosphoribosylformylglycinamidine synthase subunit PurQ / glutaminase